MRITGDEIRRQVAERYPEARPVSLEAPPVDTSGWRLFALLPLLAGVGSVLAGDYLQAPVFVPLAVYWAALPERVTFALSTLVCVGIGAWYVVDELTAPTSSSWRAFHFGVGAALLLVPVIAHRGRRAA